MKILIFNFEYPPLGGGGGVATRMMAREIVKRGHDVFVITSRLRKEAGFFEDEGVHVYRVRVWGRSDRSAASLVSLIWYLPGAFWRGFRLMRTHKFNVVNAQFVLPSGIPAIFLAWLFRIPVVVSFIGGDVYDPSKLSSPHKFFGLRVLVRWLARHASALTAISNDVVLRVREHFDIQREITVTHLGFTPKKEVLSISRDALGLPGNKQVWVAIGRLIARKGFDTLISAWRNVPNEALLVIVGDGPLRDVLQQQIETFELQSRVRLAGFLSEKRKQQLLLSADGFVSAAHHEGFGIVILEAMSAGLPVVSTNVGGQTDFLRDFKNSRLVPPDDIAALSKALGECVGSSQLRNRLGAQGRIDARKFTWVSATDNLLSVLIRVAT